MPVLLLANTQANFFCSSAGMCTTQTCEPRDLDEGYTKLATSFRESKMGKALCFLSGHCTAFFFSGSTGPKFKNNGIHTIYCEARTP